ncbi:MAG: hypothetical protein JWN88_1628 [Frankiales bacterium]|nr:hypothetical protein [Frankiales bacterium]
MRGMTTQGRAPSTSSRPDPPRVWHAPTAESHARFRALLEQPFVPLCAVDVRASLTDVNDALCALLGLSAEELIGRHLRELTHADDTGTADLALMDVLSGGRLASQAERILRHREGAPVSVQVSIAGVRDEDGAVTGATAFLIDMTALRESERRTSEQAEFLAAVGARATDLALIGDDQGRITYASPSVAHVLGYDPARIPGVLGWDFVHPDDVEATRTAYMDVVRGGGTSCFEFRVRLPDGSWRWVEETATNLLDTAVHGVVCNLRDIQARIDAEQALVASEARYRAIADTAEEGIWVVAPDGITSYANARMAQILGLDLEAVYAAAPGALLDAAQASVLAQRVEERVQRGVERYEVVYLHPDGTPRQLAVTASPLHTPEGTVLGSLGMVSDVTAARAVEEEMRRAALHDSLTGLPNRALALDRLEHALSREGQQVAVLFIDLDHFKLVNDSRGHRTGDQLLVAVAKRLVAAARSHDTVARFGGDEFVVICEDVDVERAQEIANDLLASLAGRFDIDEARVDVRASIGLALSPDATADDLLRYADTAMYSAKAAGRGRVRLFDRALAEQAEERYALAAQLRVALEQDELSVHYQPVVEMKTGRVVGVEALARWKHPTEGDISPNRFVPVAELTGLSPELDRWVLRRALADAGQLRGDGTLPPDAYIAVNLSARNLGDGDLEETIAEAAARAGFAAEHVVLEITETAIMDDAVLAVDLLGRLRARGFQVAIDDFGTGYSSLAYLSRLPITCLKVDRSFVAGIVADQDSLAIVASIVDLARTIGVTVVAEGVETEEQARLLRKLGCATAQGWLWSAATPMHVARASRQWRDGFPMPPSGAASTPSRRREAIVVSSEHGLHVLIEMHRQGASLATIAAALNQDGFRAPTGARWHRTSVARAVSSLAYPALSVD